MLVHESVPFLVRGLCKGVIQITPKKIRSFLQAPESNSDGNNEMVNNNSVSWSCTNTIPHDLPILE